MLSRLDRIIQGAEDAANAALTAAGVPNYVLTDAYPTDDGNPLTETIIVVGTNHRESPEQRELGGMLVAQRTRIMIDVLAQTEAIGQSITGYLTESVFVPEMRVQLYDYTTTPPTPTESVRIDNVLADRLTFAAPRPWQEHWFTILVAIEDEYDAPVS